MAYYAKEDEYYQGFLEETEDQHREERLVEALGFHVQDSVNQALIKALKPSTVSLRRYGQRELRGRTPNLNVSGEELTPDLGLAQRASVGPSSSEIFALMAFSVLKDHDYEPFALLGRAGLTSGRSPIALNASQSTSSHFSVSEQAKNDPKAAGTRKRKSKNVKDSQALCNLSFDPQAIIRPRSTEWIPYAKVVHYVQDRIRKGFDRDVCRTLRSECPCTSLLGKVVETPELDRNLATFMRKFSKDPKKGLDGAWKCFQHKLLDISGPITKNFELAVHAKEANAQLDVNAVLEWA
ncbi:hypothetical protein NDU88_003152 [Pleurodeles waltl]|uniref:Uncharacterized protein n=1 Tax=Pleurodeles waltl TaxID=8319 RepID=A0AAV7W4H9_PLEWA|nr:hypothetical protein NDU88_003152 [Pleurodeles waltl]